MRMNRAEENVPEDLPGSYSDKGDRGMSIGPQGVDDFAFDITGEGGTENLFNGFVIFRGFIPNDNIHVSDCTNISTFTILEYTVKF